MHAASAYNPHPGFSRPFDEPIHPLRLPRASVCVATMFVNPSSGGGIPGHSRGVFFDIHFDNRAQPGSSLQPRLHSRPSPYPGFSCDTPQHSPSHGRGIPRPRSTASWQPQRGSHCNQPAWLSCCPPSATLCKPPPNVPDAPPATACHVLSCGILRTSLPQAATHGCRDPRTQNTS